jgi:hypothetical protein
VITLAGPANSHKNQPRTLFTMNCPKCKDEGVIRNEYLGLLSEWLCECKAEERLGEIITKIVIRSRERRAA